MSWPERLTLAGLACAGINILVGTLNLACIGHDWRWVDWWINGGMWKVWPPVAVVTFVVALVVTR